MKRTAWHSPLNLIAGPLGGAALAVLPIDLYLIGIPLFAVWVIATARQGYEKAGMQLAITAAVLVAAWFAPVKHTHERLRSPVVLPATTFTLGELEQATSRPDRHEGVPYATWRLTNQDRQVTIKVPRQQLSLGEFVRAVESQTTLRHKFISCANGSTILFGIEPGTLFFRDPNRPWQAELAMDEQDLGESPLSPLAPAR